MKFQNQRSGRVVLEDVEKNTAGQAEGEGEGWGGGRCADDVSEPVLWLCDALANTKLNTG